MIDFWDEWDVQTRLQREKAGFDPAQPRDPEGKWTETGGWSNIPYSGPAGDTPDIRQDLLPSIEQALAKEIGQDNLDKIKKNAKDILDKTELGIWRGVFAFEDIMKTGRFKTQYETSKSGGKYDPSYRERAEKDLFGTKRPLDDKPVYGMLMTPGKAYNAQGYGHEGEVLVILKDEVKKRATFTIEDSLTRDILPSAMADPSPASLVYTSWLEKGKEAELYKYPKVKEWMQRHLQELASGTNVDLELLKKYYGGSFYAEFQAHNGVTVNDIKEVRFRRPSDLSPQVKKWATEHGITVRAMTPHEQMTAIGSAGMD